MAFRSDFAGQYSVSDPLELQNNNAPQLSNQSAC